MSLGEFTPLLSPIAWWDEEEDPLAWFDRDLISASTGHAHSVWDIILRPGLVAFGINLGAIVPASVIPGEFSPLLAVNSWFDPELAPAAWFMEELSDLSMIEEDATVALTSFTQTLVLTFQPPAIVDGVHIDRR